MADHFLGEIQMAGFTFVPSGWAACDGTTLNVNSYNALFALIGNMFGGDGVTTFKLPDLRGRVPVGIGTGYALAQTGGEETHALTSAEMPAHTHAVTGSSSAATTASPTGAVWAVGTNTAYSPYRSTTMNAAAITSTGSGAAHTNLPPYAVVNFIIALTGLYPTRP